MSDTSFVLLSGSEVQGEPSNPPPLSRIVPPKAKFGTPEWLAEVEADREQNKVYQFAFWPDEKRAMPSDFIACALFAGIQEKDISYLDGVEIANANDMRIVFKGNRLTQVHADIWQGIMHLARQMPEGSKVRFRARSFLRLIGRHTGQKQRKDLKGWFTDLTATSVEIIDTKNHKPVFWGSLLPNGACQDENGDTVFVVEINRMLAKLFANNIGAADWHVRQKLFKKPLALWWQFYSSKFKKPVAVSELHRLSGSAAQLKEFRRKLAIAIAVVAEKGGQVAYIDRATDTAVLSATPLPATAKAASVQPSLPLSEPSQHPAVSDRALAQFRKRYPGKNAHACLAAFRKWLSDYGKTADNPDAAYLGFAKGWGGN